MSTSESTNDELVAEINENHNNFLLELDKINGARVAINRKPLSEDDFLDLMINAQEEVIAGSTKKPIDDLINERLFGSEMRAIN